MRKLIDIIIVILSSVLMLCFLSCSKEVMNVHGTYIKNGKEMMYGRVNGYTGADREAKASKRKLRGYNDYLLMLDTTIIHNYRYEVEFRKTKVKK